MSLPETFAIGSGLTNILSERSFADRSPLYLRERWRGEGFMREEEPAMLQYLFFFKGKGRDEELKVTMNAQVNRSM